MRVVCTCKFISRQSRPHILVVAASVCWFLLQGVVTCLILPRLSLRTLTLHVHASNPIRRYIATVVSVCLAACRQCRPDAFPFTVSLRPCLTATCSSPRPLVSRPTIMASWTRSIASSCSRVAFFVFCFFLEWHARLNETCTK